jgi:hypothetical protein
MELRTTALTGLDGTVMRSNRKERRENMGVIRRVGERET